MKYVYLVQHISTVAVGFDVRTVGIYASLELALQAINRLKALPGFLAHPTIVDKKEAAGESGFYIEDYVLGHDEWPAGFANVPN